MLLEVVLLELAWLELDVVLEDNSGPTENSIGASCESITLFHSALVGLETVGAGTEDGMMRLTVPCELLPPTSVTVD